jgi:tetratricopeptide (TPR) repeat protein
MRRLNDGLLAGVLVALTVLAYLPVLNNDFVNLDDDYYITKNEAVLKGWTRPTWRWAWRTYYGTYWQPLSWLSLQGDVQLFAGRSPDGQVLPSAVAAHAQNVLWHTASGVLLFFLLLRMTGARWRSFFVAAVFVLHPLRVESVAWAAERKDVLSCFFGLLTLWLYTSYAARPNWLRYLGVCLAFLVSLLCKPTLMTLPFILLLLDYWPLGRLAFAPAAAGGPAPVPLGRLLREKVPLFALAAWIVLVTWQARQQTDPGISYEDIPLFDRLANAATGYGWYLAHSAWPAGLGLMYPHPGRDWSVLAALTGTAVVLALTLLCAWQAGRRPWLLVGWLWFLGCLFPVMGWAQTGGQAWADRFTYWPHVGLLIAVVWAVAEAAAFLRVPAAAVGAAGALVLGGLVALTARQVDTWHDPVTLWEQTLAVTQDNHIAHGMLGRHYQDKGQWELARAQFAEAVRIQPTSPDYQYRLGDVLLALRQDTAAEVHLRAAVELNPRFYLAQERLSQVQSLRQMPGTPTN